MTIKEFYNTYWKRGGYVLKACSSSEYKKKYIENIKLANSKILDIGCGDGSFSKALLKDDNEVFGLDISEAALEVAVSRGIHAKCWDINSKFPFDAGFFDAVFILDTLEHVFDPGFVLKESQRVLKKNGSIYCIVPNISMIVNRLYFLFTGDFKDCSCVSDKIIPELSFPDHIRFFSPKSLEKMLTSYNFEIKNIDYWFPLRFDNPASRKFNWIAKIISLLRLVKIFPGLISCNIIIEAYKK